MNTLAKEQLTTIIDWFYNCSKYLNCDIYLDKEDLRIITNEIYQNLKLRINDSEYLLIIDHYLKLLMADVIDDNLVNTSWAIDHLWYITIGIQDKIDVKKYNDCIPSIQNKLLKTFDIPESLKHKLRRKIVINYLTK